MKKFRYKTLQFNLGGGFKWNKGFNVEEIDLKLNEMGEEGWELVTKADNTQSDGTVNIILIFKQEVAVY